jgi:hypothetical protein
MATRSHRLSERRNGLAEGDSLLARFGGTMALCFSQAGVEKTLTGASFEIAQRPVCCIRSAQLGLNILTMETVLKETLRHT